MLFGPNNFNPIQNYSEGKIQYENALNLFKENEYLLMNLDPWLYHALYLIQYLIRAIINKGTEKRLQFFEECLAKTKNIPYDGEQIFWFFCNILGAIYTYLGRFQDANEMFSVKPLKENPLIIALNMQNKAKLSYVQGNLNKSIYFAEIGLKYCNENSFGWGVSLLKTSLAMYYAEKGENEIAKQYFLDLIPLKKITLNPFHIVYSYYSLIRFLTNSYQLTNDYSNIQEAKTFFKEVKDIVSKYIDNRNVENYLKICEGIILKFGRFKDKYRAYEILKEMSSFYSHNLISIQLKFDLIELQIDEAKSNLSNLDVLNEIINELDGLITDIKNQGILYTRKGSIIKYIQHQILVSRYYFYIKGKSQEAIEILISGNKELEKYDLPELKKKVELEINKITHQVKTYTNQSVQERLNKNEIDIYFNLALQLKDN